MDPRPPSGVVWSRRAARAVLALVVIVLGTVTVFSYFMGRATSPDPLPPLEPDWTAIVDVLAGDGQLGVDDGDASHARFSDLFGVAVAADGTVFVSDAGEAQRIRRVTQDGAVSTIAGGTAGFADGAGVAARFDTPSALALGPDGAIYVADTGNHAIRRVTAAGVVSTIAGGHAAGYRDGLALDAEFNGPVGVAVDRTGRILVADSYNDRIRAIGPGNVVTTIAGSGTRGWIDGPAMEAQFDTPCGLTVDEAGRIYVADSGNGLIRRIDPDGSVSTVEPLTGGFLSRPVGVAVGAGGVIYATDDRGRVIEIRPGSSMRVVAGSAPGFANGRGAEARMRGLAGIAVAGAGRLVVADPRNAMVRLVTAIGQGRLRTPVPPAVRPRFDLPRFADQPLLWPADPMAGSHEVVGTLGEARGDGNNGRFHAGLDVRAPDGTLVRVVRDGTVTNPVSASDFGTLNESLRVGPVMYVHMRVGRLPRNEPMDDPRFVFSRNDKGRIDHVRVRRGARFLTGEVVGTTNRFNHVHLNVGWPGEEINPLRLRLVQFEDTVQPTIVRTYLMTLAGEPLAVKRGAPPLVDRPVQIVVDAWDQVDGNESRRRLGLYELGYQVLARDGTPVAGFGTPRQTIRFDQLTLDPDAARLVYATGSGIPFYGSRSTHFRYVVTNSLAGGRASAGSWDPSSLEPGAYVIRIVARDIRGNEALAGRDLPITVARPEDEGQPKPAVTKAP